MHTILRYYTGNGVKELVERVEKNKASLETAMRKAPGFVSYSLVSLPEGCVSITVCHNKSGTDESAKLAAAWIKETGGDLNIAAPAINQGPVVVRLK